MVSNAVDKGELPNRRERFGSPRLQTAVPIPYTGAGLSRKRRLDLASAFGELAGATREAQIALPPLRKPRASASASRPSLTNWFRYGTRDTLAIPDALDPAASSTSMLTMTVPPFGYASSNLLSPSSISSLSATV